MGLVSVRVRRCCRGRGRHLVSLPMLMPIRLLRLRLRALGEGDELGARVIWANGRLRCKGEAQGQDEGACGCRLGVGLELGIGRARLGLGLGAGLGLVLG